jgi:release factor H-coupled RctB family protein
MMIQLDERTRAITSRSIEAEAERQLRAAARLRWACWAVGMGHLRPGKAHPLGAAVFTDAIVYPHLVGGGIGCGMALFQTDVSTKVARAHRWAGRPWCLERPWEGNSALWLRQFDLNSYVHTERVGTLGGGDEFASLQAVEATYDDDALRALGVDAKALLLLVHSGSRGYGKSILRAHDAFMGTDGLPIRGEQAPFAYGYLDVHDQALRWARANRALVAHRLAEAYGFEIRPLLDVTHHAVAPHEGGWLHRNGAVAHRGPIPIAGGALTYLVEPLGDGSLSGFSLPHGILGCEDEDFRFEAEPEPDQRLDRLVAELVGEGACRLIATLRAEWR